MRRQLDFIHKHGHFIRRTGHGLLTDMALGKLSTHILKPKQYGAGSVAYKHEEEEPVGTVKHHHKHSTKETHKPKRHIQSIKFNY